MNHVHYGPGHHLHWIHANQLRNHPWGWRAGVVRTCDGREAVVDYVFEPGSCVLWHDFDLQGVAAGTPVRVHEQLHALELPGAWLNVALRDGIGPVPTPAEPGLWRAEAGPVPIVDVARGAAVLDVPREPRGC